MSKILEMVVRVNAPEDVVFTIHDKDGNIVPHKIVDFDPYIAMDTANASKAPRIFMEGYLFAVELLLNQKPDPQNIMSDQEHSDMIIWAIANDYFMLGNDKWCSQDATDERAYTTQEMFVMYKAAITA